MKRLDFDNFKEIDIDKYKKRSAFIEDVETIIKEDTIIYVNNQPVLLYASLNHLDTSALRWAVKNQKYGTGIRSRGLQTQSNVFGYSPRLAMRHDYCRLSAMANEYPKQHYFITNFVNKIVDFYEQYFPEIYEKHKNVIEEKVLDEYKIGSTPFTSGIVNKNNWLKYHFDAGNFKGVLSNMVVFKKGTSGGHLCIPSLGIALEVADNTLTIFNGQDILHGVSEIYYDQKDGYRYSIVYYSLEQMWKCEPVDDEIARIQKVKTEREIKRIDPDHIASLNKRVSEFKEFSDKEVATLKIKNNLL
jgi:hypothetical protein